MNSGPIRAQKIIQLHRDQFVLIIPKFRDKMLNPVPTHLLLLEPFFRRQRYIFSEIAPKKEILLYASFLCRRGPWGLPS